MPRMLESSSEPPTTPAAAAESNRRPANDAGRGCRRRAEERAAATADRRRAIALTGALTWTLTVSLPIRRLAITGLGLLHRLATVPYRPRVTRRHVRNRAARRTPAEQRVAHGVQETAG